MGQEGYGTTMFVLGIMLLPFAFLMGGIGGVTCIIVVFGYLILKHSKMYYRSPSVVMKNINSNIYSYGRNYVNNNPKRELTDEEKRYNDLRCLIYEIAYQVSLNHKKKGVYKRDFSIAASTVPEVYIDEYGVYVKEWLGHKEIWQIYLVEFKDATKNLEQNGNIGRRRFLYR